MSRSIDDLLEREVTRLPWGSTIAAVYDDFFPDWSLWAPAFHEVLTGRGAPPSSRALDMFCGTGSLLCALSDLGWSGTGVDASMAMLELARRKAGDRPNLEFVHGHAESYQPEVASYDVVSATCDAVNHLLTWGELSSFLGGAARALRPGGHLIFDCLTGSGMRGLTGSHPTDDERGRLDRQLLYNPDLRLLLAQVEGSVQVGGSLVTVRHSLAERSYPIAELVARVVDAGFVDVDVCTLPSLEPVGLDAAEKQRSVLILARRGLT